VVVGVGINLGMSDKNGKLIDQPWTDIRSVSGQSVSRNGLAAAIIEEMMALLENFHEVGFEAYREEWLQSDINADKEVSLLLMNKTIQGIARGVDESGALKLEVGEEIKLFSGGEISVRSAG
jgi:BirA family biotin operon repressor/biotin-[acetyl-CoA-carboxylase] ligase